MSTVYLNGEYLAAENACISVFDRGFLLGDGIYEVIPAYHGALFRLDEHLVRMQNSLDAIHLQNPHTPQQWQEILSELVQRNAGGDLSVYLQVTRGVAVRDHAFPAEINQTVFAMVNPIAPPKDKGVAAITLDDNRWRNCHIKSISLLPNVLLRQQAVEKGVAEAILIRDGQVTEGAASNLFIVKNGRIITPPKGPFLLPGITRDLVLELAEKNHIPHAEEDISPEQLRSADEVWLTSSTKEILAVTTLDGQKVGDGEPGAVWLQMRVLYRAYKESLRQLID